MPDSVHRPRAEDLDAVCRPLAEATNLPGVVYRSEEILGIEQEELFGRMWLCVGRHEDVPEPGDFLTVEVAGERVLVLRGDDGEARAFYNVCRHRGARLVDESCGSGLKSIRCRYHAWTYGNRGELRAAPLMDRMPDFCKEDWPLRPVRLDSWGGFLFINLDPEAPDLAEAHADFPDVSRYRLAELRRGHRETYEVEANWKLLCENYSECYHCALVHPQLNRISDYTSGGKSLVGACYNGGPMELNEGFTTMSMTGRAEIPEIPGLDEDDHRLIHYFNLYPNLLLSLHPDYALVHTVWPTAADRSRVICDWLFTGEALDAGADLDDALEFWDVTNRQDWGLCEMAQQGVSSRGHRPGPYQAAETCVHAFDQWYVERLGDRLIRR